MGKMQSAALFDALFADQTQPMWVVDADTLAFLAVNDAATRLYGYTKEEFLRLGVNHVRPEADIDDVRRAFADWSNSCSQRIWRHKKKSGELITVKVTSFSFDFAGRRARLAVIEELGQRLEE